METCRKCLSSFDAPPGAPCPRCGALSETTMKSPRAATTERPAPAALMTMPAQPPATTPSASYPSTSPMPPAPLAHVQATAATVLPNSQQQSLGPYAQQPSPSPYGYTQQPIQIVVQNQIHVPHPMVPAPYVVPVYAPIHYVRRKDPGVAVLCSFFIPGGGQLYNGQIGKGLAFMVATVVNIVLLFVGIGFLTGLATWIWAMIDAHGTAERINRGEIAT